jgi:hypothetical protein
MHRGPKTGKVAKSKSVKQSARRVEEIFSSSASRLNIPHLPICLPTQVAPSTLSQSEAILGWVSFSHFKCFYLPSPDFSCCFFFFLFGLKASAISSAHPYVSKEDRLQARRARLRRIPAQQQQDLQTHQVKYYHTHVSLSLDF